MPVVSEIQELQSGDDESELSVGSINEALQRKETKSKTKANGYARQKTHGVNKKLKEIPEFEMRSQSDEKSQPNMNLTNSQIQNSVTAPNQKQQGIPTSLDQVMLEKLFRGEKAGGTFAKVKIDKNEEKESCVVRLADLNPDQFITKQVSFSKPSKDLNQKALLKQENARSQRLDSKLRQIIKIAKKRLAKSPSTKKTFRKICESLYYAKGDESESDDEDLKRQMAGQKQTAKHQLDANQRLREKLVRLGKIKNVEDLQHIDSVIESAYNSNKGILWAEQNKQEMRMDPCNSLESLSCYGLESASESNSSKESVDLETQIKQEGSLNMAEGSNPIDQAKMAMFGFEKGFTDLSPNDLISKIKQRIDYFNASGTGIPEKTAKTIYKRLCMELQTAPIDVFKHYNKEEKTLEFDNYGLSNKQAMPMVYVMPFLQTMQRITMKNCNLTDFSAAAIVDSSLGKNSSVRKIDFTGIEMGPQFINSLKNVLEQDPRCLQELILSAVKPLVSLGALSEALLLSEDLQYLNISGNSFNLSCVKVFADYLKKTEVLEFLNISQCQLRGQIAEIIADAIMLNKSIRYLDVSNNRFQSQNYIVAAKFGRMIQGHPSLLHVDFSYCQMVREELFYIILCVRDSKNIQGLHLTGNSCSHYDRLLMRALLPCKVKWPVNNSYQPKFEKITGSDKITLIMLNMCFLTTLPPRYIPEIGLSPVTTVEEVREKVRSHELKRQLEERIQENENKEYKKTEVNYTSLIESRLKTIQRQNLNWNGKNWEEELRCDGSPMQESMSQKRKKYNFNKYYNDPDRIYDMFTMIDFYGHKQISRQMGKPVKSDDDLKWKKDQKYRQMKRLRGSKMVNASNSPFKAQDMEMLKKDEEQVFIQQSDGSVKRLDSIGSLDSEIEDPASFGVSSAKKHQLGEDAETILARKLKLISQDTIKVRKDQKAREEARFDTQVISRVRQIIKLPPDHVAEIGSFANPMRGHNEKMVFTRITGHPNVAENNVWVDAHECWICERHNKLSLSVFMTDALVDQEFQDIILLTAMMQNRSLKRQQNAKDQEENMEILLEEKSQKSEESGAITDSSGSGADIEGEGDPSYENQKKEKRKGMFTEMPEIAKLNSKEHFDEFQDDDTDFEGAQKAKAEEIEKLDRIKRRNGTEIDLSDQCRSVFFDTYTEPKNLIQVGKNFTTTQISLHPESNITLFNPHLTARPIQLKNVLKTVYQEYRGPGAPDRFSQPNHRYHALNGIIYRNLVNNQSLEGISKAKKNKPTKTSAVISPSADESFLKGGKNGKILSNIDLTREDLVYRMQKGILTKFELKDSTLSKELEQLKEKEKPAMKKPLTASTQPGTTNGSMPSFDNEEPSAQSLWLQKKGFDPTGTLPAVTIKRPGVSTASYSHRSGQSVQPRTAQGSLGRQTHRADFSFAADSLIQRNVKTSHNDARSLIAEHRNKHRVAGFSGTSRPMNDPQAVPDRTTDFSGLVGCGDLGGETSVIFSKQSEKRNTHVAYNPRIQPKGEQNMDISDKQFWAIFNSKADEGTIYFISSINNWMPVLLKKNPGNPDDKEKSPINNKLDKSANRMISPSIQTPILAHMQVSTAPGTMQNMDLTKVVNLAMVSSGLQMPERANSNLSKTQIALVPKNRLTSRFLAGENENSSDFPDFQADKNFPSGKLAENERFQILKRKKPCPGHKTEIGSTSCQITKINQFINPEPRTLKVNKQRTAKRQVSPKMRSPISVTDLDNVVELHMFCRPGKHHFFFIRKGKHFMLSSRFPIEKFKQTNIQMNYVEVPARGWKIDPPMVDRDTEWKDLGEQEEDGDEDFDKAKSLFRNYKLDTPALLEKMFENDFRLTKIPKLIKDKDQLQKVKTALLEHYPFIKNMYLALTCNSVYPAINQADYLYWIQMCKFLEKPYVQQAELDTQVIASTFKTDLSRKIDSAKGEILRFEFLEVIVRLSQLCYKNEIKDDSAAAAGKGKKKKGNGKIYMFQAISKLIKEHLEPSGLEVADVMSFKTESLYTSKVSQYFERNEFVLKKIHSEYNYAGKVCMNPNEAILFVTVIGKLGFIHERSVLKMYGYSKMSTVDYLKTPRFPQELYFVEFLEFFARLAFFTFLLYNEAAEKEDDLQLYEKIDGLLAHYCKELRLQRQYTVLPEDQNGCVQEMINYMAEERLRKAQQRADSTALVTSESMADSSWAEADKNDPSTKQRNSLITINALSGTPSRDGEEKDEVKLDLLKLPQTQQTQELSIPYQD